MCTPTTTEPGPRPVDRLRHVWHEHVSDDDALFDRLVARHRENHRRYHTVAHVDAVVEGVCELAAVENVVDLGAVIAAALYHDAIYEPESHANERASARLARRDLLAMGWPEPRSGRVAVMIEGTDRHLAPDDTDTAVLFDADLAILGSVPEEYAHYVDAVRSEYDHVSDADWVVGRAAVLRGFEGRESIYTTDSGRHRWEATARSNLAAELHTLER